MQNAHSPKANAESPRRISVDTSARIHLGFIDLTRRRARQFGSLGLCLEGPRTEVVAASRRAASETQYASLLNAAPGARAAEIAEALALPLPPALFLVRQIPRHSGLGSGTQMGLALAAAIAGFHGRTLDAAGLARASGRGRRSGVGIAAFEQGGFLVDAGRATHTVTPPLIARQAWPEDWRVVLISDACDEGLSGSKESAAFESLPGMSAALANELAYLTLMVLLPAIAERDFLRFTRAVGRIQAANGAHFSTAQNGCYSSPRVAAVLNWLEANGRAGFGQSSWGPTGFVFSDSEHEANALATDLARRFGAAHGVSFSVVRGRNRGADICVAP